MYEIRFCSENEVDKLQLYIKKNIRENEILANDIDFLKWQCFNKKTRCYNFITIFHRETNEIIGYYSIYPLYQFDEELLHQNNIWAFGFSIKKSARGKGFGRKLITYVDETIKPNSHCAIGISDMALPLFKSLGFKTGFLNHYFMLNGNIGSFRIVTNDKKYHFSSSKEIKNYYCTKEIYSLENIELDIVTEHEPKKSIQYLKNRYFNHPVYKYRFFLVTNNSKKLSIVVIKKIFVCGTSCIRVIDILGDLTTIEYINFKNIMERENSEYLDFLNHGIDERVFYSAGFQKRNNTDIIIPEHFEPVEQRNIEIAFAYKSNSSDYVMFKGDSSIDRPSKYTG